MRRERNYMPNFIFISPAFPGNYENFCVALRANGVNVLGIGDTPYDCLSPRLKSALTEYYRVENMENYDEMFRAVAFLSFHHGKIDYLESNNEYWLTQDARLREDFHITTGLQPKDMDLIKYKSKMKAGYEKAGIPCARYHLISDLTSAQNFIREVGYPVIVNQTAVSVPMTPGNSPAKRSFLTFSAIFHPFLILWKNMFPERSALMMRL